MSSENTDFNNLESDQLNKLIRVYLNHTTKTELFATLSAIGGSESMIIEELKNNNKLFSFLRHGKYQELNYELIAIFTRKRDGSIINFTENFQSFVAHYIQNPDYQLIAQKYYNNEDFQPLGADYINKILWVKLYYLGIQPRSGIKSPSLSQYYSQYQPTSEIYQRHKSNFTEFAKLNPQLANTINQISHDLISAYTNLVEQGIKPSSIIIDQYNLLIILLHGPKDFDKNSLIEHHGSTSDQ